MAAQMSLTREGVAKAFALSPETQLSLEEAGVLGPEPDGTYDLVTVAANLFNYGMRNAQEANARLLAAASALNDTLPALERLSALADHAELDGPARERITQELARFFDVFSKALSRATESLKAAV